MDVDSHYDKRPPDSTHLLVGAPNAAYELLSCPVPFWPNTVARGSFTYPQRAVNFVSSLDEPPLPDHFQEYSRCRSTSSGNTLEYITEKRTLFKNTIAALFPQLEEIVTDALT